MFHGDHLAMAALAMLQGDYYRRQRDDKEIVRQAADIAAERVGLVVTYAGDIKTADGGEPTKEQKIAFVEAFETAQKYVIIEKAERLKQARLRDQEAAARRAAEAAAANEIAAQPFREQRRLRKAAMAAKGVYGKPPPG